MASSVIARLSLRASMRSIVGCHARSKPMLALSAIKAQNCKFSDSVLGFRPLVDSSQFRFYSAAASTKADVESRVLVVCKAFDKITADKVTLDSHFINDLGLDSLDHVEVIMAVEDEFGFEIPDEHAEKLLTPAKIAQYICDHERIMK